MAERVLIITIPAQGHINPLVGVARRLDEAGAQVTFLAAADLSSQLRAAGIHTPCRLLDDGFVPPEEHTTGGEPFARRSQDRAWLRRWIRRLLLETAPGQIGPLRDAIAAERPDVIVTDPMMYASAIAAEAEGVPWVGVSSSLNPVTPESWRCELVDTVEALSDERAALFESCGMTPPPFKVCDAISPWLNIVFTTEAYVPRALSGNTASFHVGPSNPGGPRGDESDFPWDRVRKERPLIYMALGSQNFYHPHLFDTVVEALSTEPVQLVLACGDLAHTPFAEALPSDVIAVPYAPQLALLDRASLVISHGGANSVMESLTRGLPIAMLPLVNDQPLQARFLSASGAGAVLDPDNLTSEGCRHTLRALLDPSAPERQRAQTIGRSYRAHDGAAETAALILKLARDRNPLLPAP